MNKVKTLILLFLTLFLVPTNSYAQNSSEFKLSGEYKATTTSAITHVFFEQDRVVVSVDISKEAKNTNKVLSIVGGAIDAMQTDSGKKELIKRLKSSQTNTTDGYYFAGVPNYNAKYGNFYFVLYRPTIKKVDSTWVISTADDRVMFLLDVQNDNKFTDEQNISYEKVNDSTVLWLLGGVTLLAIAGTIIVLKKRK